MYHKPGKIVGMFFEAENSEIFAGFGIEDGERGGGGLYSRTPLAYPPPPWSEIDWLSY